MNLSYQQIQARLQTALNDADASLKTQEYGYLYVQDVWPSSVVYASFDGKSYQRTYVIADDGSVTLGDRSEVLAQTIYLPVPSATVAGVFNFSKEDAPAGRFRFSGKLFEEGDYGKKGKYDKEKCQRLVDNFPADGVFVKDTHLNTFLGKCMEEDATKVLRTWIEDKDTNGVVRREIHGEVETPEWVAQATRNRTKSMSIGLTPDGSTIREVSLALTPHVEDAAVFDREVAAAFSKSPSFPAFAAAHPDDARLVTEAAKAPVPPETMPTKEQKIEEAKKAYPTLPQFMRDAQTEAEFVAFSLGEKPSPTTDSKTTEQDAKIARLEKEAETRASTDFARHDEYDAKEFYGEMLQAGKADPADKDAIVATFTKRAAADRAMGVTFSKDDKDASLVGDLRREWAAKPAKRTFGKSHIASDVAPTFSDAGLGIFSRNEKGELI